MEDDLVAVTHECDYPDSVRAKPVLTRSVLSGASSGAEVDRHIRELVHEGSSIYALDAPLLEALHPDLILTQELCEVCAVSYPIVERAARRLGSSPQLVSIAGGDERLGVARHPAHAIDWQQLIDADPEVVVVMACGFSLERSLQEVESARGHLYGLGADIWVVDGNAFFSRPGPRLVDSLEIMAGILHPGAVDAPHLATARRLQLVR